MTFLVFAITLLRTFYFAYVAVIVLCFYPTVLWVGLWLVIMAFSGLFQKLN